MAAKKTAKRASPSRKGIKKAAKTGRFMASKSGDVAISDAVAASIAKYRDYPGAKLVVVTKPGAKGKPRIEAVGRITYKGGTHRYVKIESITTKAVPQIEVDAFEPDAKARALLRGVELAQQDLADSGGSFTLEQVLKLLGVTRQRVHEKVQQGELFSVKAPGGRIRFPVVQFTQDGPIEGLKEVVRVFPSKNPWMLLNFLVHPDSRLGDRKPIDLLKQGDTQPVVGAARSLGMQGA
jgi:hypothetical protein